MTVEEMRARLSEIDTELEEIRDAEFETAEEQDEAEGRTDQLLVESDELLAGIRKLEQREERRSKLRAAVENGTARIEEGSQGPAFTGRASDKPYNLEQVRNLSMMPNTDVRRLAVDHLKRDDTLREVEKDDVRRLIEKDSSGRIARHWVAAASDEYRSAWSKAITGNADIMTNDEREAMHAVRAASLTDAAGGYAVPSPLDPTIVSTKAYAMSPLRQISTVKTITNDVWRGVTSAGATASFDAEAAEVSDDAPTLVQPTITPAKGQVFVPASIEITEDWAGMAGDLAQMFAEAKADLENTAFITGSGTNAPVGIVTALLAASTTSQVDATTASVFGLVDLFATHEALPVRHRSRATWLANNAIINDIRQFGTANVYFGYTVDLQSGAPAQLLGRPLYEASAMDSTITTDAEILVFGDFSRYVIVDRVGFSVEFIPHLFGTTNARPTGQRGWYGYWRVGADSIDDNAFRYLQL